jgi:hypothetical protein
MRRLLLALALAALAGACLPTGALGEDFGLKEFEVSFSEKDGSPATQAASHPYAMKTNFFAKTEEVKKGEVLPVEPIKDANFSQIEGFAGNASAVPTCSTLDFLNLPRFEEGGDLTVPACAEGSVVGVVAIYLRPIHEALYSPVYMLDPAPGTAAKLGFWAEGGVPVTVDVGVSEEPPYEIVGASTDVSQILTFFGAELTLWGNPASKAHDAERGACRPGGVKKNKEPDATCPARTSEIPFLTMPSACDRPLFSSFETDSWTNPGAWVEGEAPSPPMIGCGKLSFGPTILASPTTRAAQSPTGLDFDLNVEDEGLTNPSEGATAASDIEAAIVTLPRGMTINPAQAEGLEVCSEAQLEAESADSAPGEGCPEASKIGTIEVETPLLEGKLLKGSLFVAKPYENPFGSLIAFYIVIKSKELGISIVQPTEVKPDPVTGQLVATTEEIPQLPFSHFRLHFREGARSPLVSPPGCGHFTVEARLFPYSGAEAVTSTSSFEIVSGPDNSPCPTGPAPFAPGFQAGSQSAAANAYSPFVMRLTRKDGEQDMSKFSFVLPPGVVPRLAGIPYCPEAGVAAARARTGEHGGQQELDHPSCPQAAKIGRTVAGAGVGPQLTYVPGSVYLAGPYHGDPLSAVAITPAVAGPFDAGAVVVREALRLNPVTHVGEVDGSASDPIPHILQGIPLNVRELQVYADKPEFTRNPTNCARLQAASTIWGAGTALSPAPETPVTLTSPYQAVNCAKLGFKPKLAIKLKGGTLRGSHPALKAVVTPRPKDANFAAAAVRLPHSAFLDQGHIRTICTRVQFAAGDGNGAQCPKGSVYGEAKAWSPLLDEPLEGPVFLRSSSHNLPDLVIALHGLVDIDLAARIDSVHGGIRTSFTDIPDAPVSRFVLDMQGAQKGLIVNSRNLCLKPGKNRAQGTLTGQNGRVDRIKPVVGAQGCGGKKHRGHRKRAG